MCCSRRTCSLTYLHSSLCLRIYLPILNILGSPLPFMASKHLSEISNNWLLCHFLNQVSSFTFEVISWSCLFTINSLHSFLLYCRWFFFFKLIPIPPPKVISLIIVPENLEERGTHLHCHFDLPVGPRCSCDGKIPESQGSCGFPDTNSVKEK